MKRTGKFPVKSKKSKKNLYQKGNNMYLYNIESTWFTLKIKNFANLCEKNDYC